MKVQELFSEVRNTLQDLDKAYWDDSELLSYYNECKRNMAAERLENKNTATLTLDPLKNQYDTTGILRYIRAEDDEGTKRKLYPNDESGESDTTGIIILDYNKVYVNDPTIGSVITFSVVSMPNEDNMSSSVRIGDETALRYYILSKAYEKDADMGNFQKADYFYNKFRIAMKMLLEASSANYSAKVPNTTVSYFY